MSLSHRFAQDTPVHFFRSGNSENRKNSRRQIEVAGRDFIGEIVPKVWAGRDQEIVHIERTQGCVSAGAGFAVPVSVDHSTNAKLVRLIIPGKRHYDIRTEGCIDLDVRQGKGAFDFFARENHAGKIRLLQPVDDSLDYAHGRAR